MNAANRGMTMSGAVTLTAVFLAFAVACMILTARMKGLWLDEVWSLWMSRHDLGFVEAAQQRWLQDTNPPFFYMAAWVAEPLTRPGLFGARLLNLIPLAMALGAGLYLAVTRVRVRSFALIFAVLLAASPELMRFFGEDRSYFSQLCFAGVLALVLYVIEVEGRDFDLNLDKGLAAVGAGAVLFAFNLHQAAALIAGCVLGLAILSNLRAGRRRWAALLFAFGVVGAIPMIVFMLIQAPYLKTVARDFWIVTSTREAAWIMTSTTLKALALNAAAVGAATLVVVEAVNRRRNRKSVQAPRCWAFVAAMTVGVAVACVTLLVLNAVKPLIIPRYLVTLVPYWSAVLAALGAEVILGRRWVFALFLANAALIGAYATQDEALTGNWNDNAELIRDTVAACPTTLVYAIDPVRLTPTGIPEHTPPNAPSVHEWGYGYEATAYGFAVRIDHPSQVAALPLSPGCPTMLWAEHTYGLKIDKTSAARLARLPLDAAALKRTTMTTSDSGFVLSVAPAPVPALVKAPR